jgi:hypothetical protein
MERTFSANARVLRACALAAALLVLAVAVRPARSLPSRGEPNVRSSSEPLPAPPAAADGPRQRGVALGLFAEDVSFSYRMLIDEIAALGATHVALVVPLYQEHAASTEIQLHTRLSPTLEATADAIRLARRAGLEVTVFPIVRLSHPRGPGEWRGTLAPADRDAWFASYGRILGELGTLAALTGASRLVVGSELSSLDRDLPRWRPLVTRIRAVFGETLVYSANWDHYQEARLFELVDEQGVVAYFDLRAAHAPSDVASLTARWRRLRLEIESHFAGSGKPFVFTEVGYRSRRGCTAAPWDESGGGTADPEEQSRAFEAFRQAWSTPGLARSPLGGLYVWNWYGHGGPDTTGYTPRGKPALAVIRRILDEL